MMQTKKRNPHRKGDFIMLILTILAAAFYLPLYVIAKLARRYY